jgi:hypothetical protein
MKMPTTAWMIIDQRRPAWSATQPQNPLARNATAFASAIGNATIAGSTCRSFWRCVANRPYTE